MRVQYLQQITLSNIRIINVTIFDSIRVDQGHDLALSRSKQIDTPLR